MATKSRKWITASVLFVCVVIGGAVGLIGWIRAYQENAQTQDRLNADGGTEIRSLAEFSLAHNIERLADEHRSIALAISDPVHRSFVVYSGVYNLDGAVTQDMLLPFVEALEIGAEEASHLSKSKQQQGKPYVSDRCMISLICLADSWRQWGPFPDLVPAVTTASSKCASHPNIAIRKYAAELLDDCEKSGVILSAPAARALRKLRSDPKIAEYLAMPRRQS